MLDSFRMMLKKFINKRHKHSLWYRIMMVLSMIVVFMTTYMLILPAITMEHSPICGFEEHTHDESCYETGYQLICGLDEGEEHTHDESCYEEETVLVCGMEEHIHTDDCYAKEEDTDKSVDNAEEITEGETEHIVECAYLEDAIQTAIGTGTENFVDLGENIEIYGSRDSVVSGSGIDVGADDSYNKDDNSDDVASVTGDDTVSGSALELTTTEKDSEESVESTTEYVPSDEEMGYICGMEEHTHSEACYNDEGDIICGKEAHIHTELCLGNDIMLLKNEDLDINDLTYSFVMNPDTSYTLIITGNGSRIPAKLMDRSDLSKYRNLISKIDIQVTSSSNLSIGEMAFSKCSALKEVCINKESNVDRIEKGAFSNCPYLESFEFENCGGNSELSIESGSAMEEGAFYNTGLKEITLSKISRIGSFAFAGSKKLKSVNFSPEITSLGLGDGAFQSCSSLESFNWEVISDKITLEGGDIADAALFKDCTSLKSIIIPDNLAMESFPECFFNCSSLQDLTFEENTTTTLLPKRMFFGCKSLGTVDFTPLKALTKIDTEAFKNSLANRVILPKSLTTLGPNAFSDNTKLRDVVFEDGCELKLIEKWCFVNCNLLRNIDLSNLTKLEEIQQHSFATCSSLNELVIPTGVRKIGEYTFQNCYTFRNIKMNASNLETVDRNTFDGVPEGLTITIGKDVDTLKAKFIAEASNIVGKLVFEGENEFTLDENVETMLHPPLNLLPMGNYYVSAEGDLYKLEDNKTAKLIYKAESTKTSFTLPDKVGINSDYKVNAIGTYAFKDSALESISFTDISAIEDVDTYAFAQCTTLKEIQGATSVEDAKNVFLPVEVKDSAFIDTLLLGAGKSDAGEEVVFEGIKQDSADPMSVYGNEFTVKNGSNELLTGETDVVNVSLSENGTGSVFRLYFICEEDCKFLDRVQEWDDIPFSYHSVPDTNIHYYQIGPSIPGKTINHNLDFTYKNGAPSGSSLKLWAVRGTNEIFDKYGNVAIMPNTVSETDGLVIDERYLETVWNTESYVFPVVKGINKSPQFVITNDNKCAVSNLSYWIRLEEAEGESVARLDRSKPLGSDYVKYVNYKDTLTLPTGLSWRDGIKEAISKRDYRTDVIGINTYLYVIVEGVEYQFVTIRANGGTGKITKPELAIDDEGKIVIMWRNDNINLSYGKEVNRQSTDMIFGSDVILYDNSGVDNSGGKPIPIEFSNHVVAEEIHQFSAPQTREYSTKEKRNFSSEGKLEFTKIRLNEDQLHKEGSKKFTYLGEDVSYKITAKNSSPFKYNKLSYIRDDLDNYQYIKPENIQALFDNCAEGESVKVEIRNATIVSDAVNDYVSTINKITGAYTSVENTGKDTDYGIKISDDNRITDSAVITLEKNDEGVIILTVNIGGQTDYYNIGTDLTIDEAFKKIGYMVTFKSQYDIYWYMDGLESTTTKEYIVDATYKNTFMLLDRDVECHYGYNVGNGIGSDAATDVSNYAYANDKNGRQLAFAKPSDGINLKPEVGVSKSLNVNNVKYTGSENEVEFADKSILNYEVTLSHFGSSSYELLPIVDRLTGLQGLLAPISENNEESWINNVRNYNNDYYLLIPPDGQNTCTFNGVWIGGYYADSVTVTRTADGYDTLIKWYLKNTLASQYTTALSYNVIADKRLLGFPPDLKVYRTNNVAYLNDRESHRLLDMIGGFSLMFGFDKKIVTNKGMTPVHDELDKNDFTKITKQNNVVTYRLEFDNFGGMLTSVKGTHFYDVLPNNCECFSWDKASNVSVKYKTYKATVIYKGKNIEGSEDGSEIYITDTNPATGESGIEGQQYLKWDDKDFEIDFDAGGKLYIYVTLTFPGVDELDVWNSYVEKQGVNRLHNTLYSCNLPQEVSHELSEPGKAFLQKGVYETGFYIKGNRNVINNPNYVTYYKGNDRYTYKNSTDNSYNNGSVAYYVILKNSSQNAKLYLTTIYDELPKGYKFLSVRNTVDVGSGTEGDASSRTAVGDTAAISNSVPISDISNQDKIVEAEDGTPVDCENNFVKLSEELETGDGRHILKFDIYSAGGTLDSQHDETGYYLLPGQWIQFGYECIVDTKDKTDDVAVNSAAMLMIDPDNEIQLDNDTKVTVSTKWNDAEPNDGERYMWDNKTAASHGFYGGSNDSRWLASDVTVYRGTEKVPGIVKTARERNIYLEETATWDVTAYNDGTMALSDYTIEDTIEAPQHFSGNVKYAAYIYDKFISSNVKTYGNTDIDRIAYNNGDYLFKVVDRGKVSIANETGLEIITNTNDSAILDFKGTEQLLTFSIRHEGLIDSNVKAYVSFIKNDDRETLRLRFSDPKWAILPNGSMKLTYETQNLTGVYNPIPAIYNTSLIIPSDKTYDESKVDKGVNISQNGQNYGVRSMAYISTDISFPTTASKTITDTSDPANSAVCGDNKSYILIKDKSTPVTYTLTVDNSKEKVMDKLVLIDNLPEEGDKNTISSGIERGSQFKVRLADNPAFKVTLTDENNNVTNLSEDSYKLQYSSKKIFTVVDWNGEGADWNNYTSDVNVADIRSIRLIIEKGSDGNPIVGKGVHVSLSFNALIDNPAEAQLGEVAWNSFAYQYVVTNNGKQSALFAAPLKVGLRIPTAPNLTKVITNEAGEPHYAKNDMTFDYIIYKGDKISFEDYSADTVGAALSANNSDFTFVSLDIKKGSSSSDVKVLSDGIKKYTYDAATKAFVATEEPWSWDFEYDGRPSKYNIVELSSDSEYKYNSTSDGLSTVNSQNYSFTYSPTSNLSIKFNNARENWEIKILKTDGDGMPIKQALFGLYSLNIADALDDTVLNEYGIKSDFKQITTDGGVTYYLSKVAYSGDDGLIEWAELTEDSYIIKEIKAPEGYLINTKINGEYTLVEYNKENVREFTFVNDLVTYELPEAGGMGTRSICILGIALVIVASVLLIIKKRMQNNL